MSWRGTFQRRAYAERICTTVAAWLTRYREAPGLTLGPPSKETVGAGGCQVPPSALVIIAVIPKADRSQKRQDIDARPITKREPRLQ